MTALSAFEIVFLVVIFFYAIQLLIFIIGFFKPINTQSEYEPFISVIVAARNEKENIRGCLDSLSKIDYPSDKLEVLVVDDFSTDETGEIIDEFTLKFPFIKKIIPTKQIIIKPGKTNAVANAIEKAKGEIIFTTDADCIVMPSWIKSTLKYYLDDVGLVCGFTFQKAYSQFTGMQNLDWIYLLTVAAGTINLNVPLSCIGNNMSYRRKAYDEVGGYQNIKFSVTEDFALLHKIHGETRFRALFPPEKSTLNVSNPCPDLRNLYRQKHRWGTGGRESKFIGYFVMFWGFASHLLMLLQFLFGSWITIFLSFIKILSDLIFISIPMKRFKLLNQLKYFISFEIYFALYVLILPILVFVDRKVVWKEREY